MSADLPSVPTALAAELTLGLATLDRRFALVWAAGGLTTLVAFGILNALIPTPFLERPIAPAPFAIATWLLSAPLMGFVLASYLSPPTRQSAAARPLSAASPNPIRDRSTLAMLGGLGSFLAIGCPVCNKVALVMLGTSGALNVYAPIQPLIGVASLALLLATAVWRLRLRARGNACAVPAPGGPSR